MSQKYIVVRGDTEEDLMTLVNEAIEAGYLVQGGVSMAYSQSSMRFRFAQAMVLSSAVGA